jgi:tetratricopeptide (TPR) repeat protein
MDEAVAAFQRGDLSRARALAEQQLAVAPTAQVQHLLGLIECRSGQLDRGIDWFLAAREGEPANIGYRVMLVRALVDAGRAGEALEAAVTAEGTSPAELALLHARGEAAEAAGASFEAADAWHRLSKVRPGDWLTRASLGNALGELGRWDEAAQAFERALELNPGDVRLRRSLAATLTNGGRLKQALEQFKRCINVEPNDVPLRISLARLLADLARDEESQAELREAAKLVGVADLAEDGTGLISIVSDRRGTPDLGALKELAQLLERSGRMEALSKLLADAESAGTASEQLGYPAAAAMLARGKPEDAKRILMGELPDLSPLRWHWLMARIEDALGNPEAAFAEAEAMNRSVRDYRGERERGRNQIGLVRRLADAVTPAWAANVPVLELGQRPAPAFVLGFPRSGTTLLDTFLMGHPEVFVLEELPLVRAAEMALGDMIELPLRSPRELELARTAYFAELDRHIEAGSSPLIVDKLPLNMLALPLIHSLFPDARIIFAQRHPCDAVLSCFMQAFDLNDSMASFLAIEDSAAFYDAAMSLWTNSCEALAAKVHKVVYEELVANPEAALTPAVQFLGLEWRDELLDHRATAKARGAISTPSYNQVTQPLNRAPSGRWRRYQEQLEPVLPVLLPWARRLGYED